MSSFLQMFRGAQTQPNPNQTNDNYNPQSIYDDGLMQNTENPDRFLSPNMVPIEEEDIPILEDLDIDIEEIKGKFKSILSLKKFDDQISRDPDMIGPFIIYILLGTLLMLSAKLVFGYIIGFGIFGPFLIYVLVNFL